MKKFIKKMLKKTEGFTLVELIVVIAILGILAGVAIPAYSGYIAKAEEAKNMQVLAAVHTAVFAATATSGEEIEEIVVSGGSVVVDPTLDAAQQADFGTFFTETIDSDLEATWTPDAGWVIDSNS